MIAMALSCQPQAAHGRRAHHRPGRDHPGPDPRSVAAAAGRRGMSILFITHDLGVVAEMADEVAVMYAAKVVERAAVGRSWPGRCTRTRTVVQVAAGEGGSRRTASSTRSAAWCPARCGSRRLQVPSPLSFSPAQVRDRGARAARGPARPLGPLPFRRTKVRLSRKLVLLQKT